MSLADPLGIAFDSVNDHFGHKIEIARYSNPNIQDGAIANVSVECVECYEVIVDVDAWWMDVAKDAVHRD